MILEMCLQIRNTEMMETIDGVIRISAFWIHTIFLEIYCPNFSLWNNLSQAANMLLIRPLKFNDNIKKKTVGEKKVQLPSTSLWRGIHENKS